MRLLNTLCRWMITDIHDAITSLAAHGKELPVGLTQEMRDEIDRLVRQLALAVVTCQPSVSILGLTCSSCANERCRHPPTAGGTCCSQHSSFPSRTQGCLGLARNRRKLECFPSELRNQCHVLAAFADALGSCREILLSVLLHLLPGHRRDIRFHLSFIG